ncbi:MAG: helix-turn-helix domain-containing protein, partial [Candidatus Aenigmatarchaeota archaeon]
MEFFQRYRKLDEFGEPKEPNIEPQHILMSDTGLEIIREIKEKIDRIEFKLNDLERKFKEHIPEKVLTESKFVQEVQSSEDIVNKIISEVRSLAEQKQPVKVIENKFNGLNTEFKPTIVETKRIEKITDLLQTHKKLSSIQLAHLMGLSRTRANEYLKQMENLGLVYGTIDGKEKYYQLV